jgi:hypothetical protein
LGAADGKEGGGVRDTPETDSCPAERIEVLCGRLERERDEARILAQWFYTRLKQVCLDNPLRENWGGILARLEEAVLDDPWLEDAK